MGMSAVVIGCRMFLKDARSYILGMCVLVIGCSWNKATIVVSACLR